MKDFEGNMITVPPSLIYYVGAVVVLLALIPLIPAHEKKDLIDEQSL